MTWHINFSIHSTPPESFKLYNDRDEIKGIVHPKINILSSFTHPHVVPNLYELLSYVEHNFWRILVIKHLMVPTDFHSIYFSTMEGSGG